MSTYQYQRLRAAANNNRQLVAEVMGGEHYQGTLWGAFTGLFGLAANELIVVTAFDGDEDSNSPLAVEREIWQPTARPLDTKPCTTQGLYVFRRFHVRANDVDEVVELSRQAWETFEHGDDYAAQPQGLFRPSSNEGGDDDGLVRLMLVTWYDGFNSWERSRNPAPEAVENFRRRHELTRMTSAVATRLVKPAAA